MSFWRAVESGFRRSVDFRGRADRWEHWFFVLFAAGVGVAQYSALSVLTALLPVVTDPQAAMLLRWTTVVVAAGWCLGGMVTVLPSLAVTVRRLHDSGHSAMWLLLLLVPIGGQVVLLVFLLERPQPFHNRWGPPPVGHGASLAPFEHAVPVARPYPVPRGLGAY